MMTRILTEQPIVPVLTVHHLDDALPMAEALVAGGLEVLEVTLRTPAALASLRLMADQVPGAIVGAGTVLSTDQYRAAEDAGAQFFVSPGATDELLKALPTHASLPGVASASEMMRAFDAGFLVQKFFPAEALGGTSLLKSIAGPFEQLHFCATGGIDASNMASYLELSNVLAVGGSWMLPKDAIEGGNWQWITELARQATAVAAAARPAAAHATATAAIL
ncbi:MAG: bifunctional 4-hydroxy-2-oxoglutarate aldolase/2-dehydro-3-deoxy-phosphogluconate aldolase [Pseudomonadales bacterium]|nr:bifunctional 4-hydroxy-2-oxoglutarate aldolase/2-dehydro-3-deoxy-phosphogluconate aldolase [Pseudomonadales bacterium]MDA0761391.1 bifunctional 4-hydroxy-2-oxoglutarate aldolase/2-dehydro-3-deoxy-phosphogluconate aldolase [Pseudomonadota bacterium]MDA0958948.1 bifunctional 4-hydroxy-2-oxoglutarate aldolase/2-dehydro-3-deoxy-phosphogluconate aldolase [Pseudomonadota bacterium]